MFCLVNGSDIRTINYRIGIPVVVIVHQRKSHLLRGQRLPLFRRAAVRFQVIQLFPHHPRYGTRVRRSIAGTVERASQWIFQLIAQIRICVGPTYFRGEDPSTTDRLELHSIHSGSKVSGLQLAVVERQGPGNAVAHRIRPCMIMHDIGAAKRCDAGIIYFLKSFRARLRRADKWPPRPRRTAIPPSASSICVELPSRRC